MLSLLVGTQQSLVAQESSAALIADPKFKAPLAMEIARLAADIETDLSAQEIIHAVDLNRVTPENIRAYVRDVHKTHGVRGTILIGDIPAARYGDYMAFSPVLTDAPNEDLDDESWTVPDGCRENSNRRATENHKGNS